MKLQLNMELANPRIAIDSASTSSVANDDNRSSSSESDFGFAFNDSNFSDRILKVEIVPDLPDVKSDGDGCTTIADWAKNRKRRREDIKRDHDETAISRSKTYEKESVVGAFVLLNPQMDELFPLVYKSTTPVTI